MNEYFCSDCCQSWYSSAILKVGCPQCHKPTLVNPKKEIKEHLIEFREITNHQPKTMEV